MTIKNFINKNKELIYVWNIFAALILFFNNFVGGLFGRIISLIFLFIFILIFFEILNIFKKIKKISYRLEILRILLTVVFFLIIFYWIAQIFFIDLEIFIEIFILFTSYLLILIIHKINFLNNFLVNVKTKKFILLNKKYKLVLVFIIFAFLIYYFLIKKFLTIYLSKNYIFIGNFFKKILY